MRWIVILLASVLVSLNALAVGPTAHDQTNSIVVLSLRDHFALSYEDPDGGSMTFTLLSAPATGTLERWNVGEGYQALAVGYPVTANIWYYSTTATNEGTDSFTWCVSDGTATSGVATVTINLTSNSAPIANPQSVDMLVIHGAKAPGSVGDAFGPLAADDLYHYRIADERGLTVSGRYELRGDTAG